MDVVYIDFIKIVLFDLYLERLNKMFTLAPEFWCSSFFNGELKRESGVIPELFPQL